MNDDISALPSAMVKHISPSSVQLDVNVKCQYRDLFWAGAGYRINDGFFGMMGLSVSNTFSLSYSYNYTTSRLLLIRGEHMKSCWDFY